MKKRFLVGIAAATAAVVMCVGLAGCGVDAKSVKGEEVTEKEWNSALLYFSEADAAYTIDCVENDVEERTCEYVDEILSGSASRVQTIKVIKNGAKEYVKETDKIEFSGDYKKIAVAMNLKLSPIDETKERYAEKGDSNYTVLSKDDTDQWTTSSSRSSIAYGTISNVLSNMNISLTYTSYEYSAALKGYVLKNSIMRDSVYIIKFNSDKKLSAIYFDYESTTKSSNRECKIQSTFHVVIDYRSETVTLPTVG